MGSEKSDWKIVCYFFSDKNERYAMGIRKKLGVIEYGLLKPFKSGGIIHEKVLNANTEEEAKFEIKKIIGKIKERI